MLKKKDNPHFKIVVLRGESFEEAMKAYARKKAFEGIKKLRQRNKRYLSTKEILIVRDQGRK